MFLSAYEETLQSLFNSLFDLLKSNAFADSNSASGTKNLPLASLLPKVKAITARLISEDLGKNPAVLTNLKATITGPQVSALCSRMLISKDTIRNMDRKESV